MSTAQEGTLERVRQALAGIPAVHAWKIVRRRVESVELFFVRRQLDMHRAREVEHFDLTLYHDFEEDGRRFRGSSTRRIPPTAGPAEIAAQVEAGVEAARFVRNPPFPLVPPRASGPASTPAADPTPLARRVEPAIEALFREDRFQEGGINSAELFLHRADVRLLNSEGLDVRFGQETGLLELITSWRGPQEEVEMYGQERFPGVPLELLARTVREQLEASRDRAHARPTPGRRDLPVLLVGEPVRELLGYYRDQTAAESVFKQLSTARVGRALQAEDGGADPVSLSLDPGLDGSPDSAPFDGDGFPLAPARILERGVVRRLWGGVRFCSYLGLEPTGETANFLVEPGSLALAEMHLRPHLELRSFSDFQCHTTTGDFGGEIRLGYLVDGGSRVPVTGGSIGGNILDVQRTMRLSREIWQKENFRGPRAVLLSDVAVAGAAS